MTTPRRWARAAAWIVLLLGAASSRVAARADADWLIDPTGYVAEIRASEDGRDVVLANGLVRRTIRLAPNAATIAFDNLMTGQAELRSVRPEATITIDGHEYAVGGLEGQPIHNYLLPEWIEAMMCSIDSAVSSTACSCSAASSRIDSLAWASCSVAWAT